jgi:hypothetical protein
VDDAEILRLTGKHLEERGFDVTLKSPDELGAPTDALPTFIFLMCEGVDVLRQLRAWETAGVRQVNSPDAVVNTYRERMIAQLQEGGVPVIPSRIVSTATPPRPPKLPIWVKRPDVHNTQAGDVVFAADERTLHTAVEGLAARGIDRAVLQEHLEGDLIKFYGIGAGGPDGGPSWFRWFYHRDQTLANHPMDPGALARLARRAGGALGLEIYGGDAIATADGRLVLLDLNAWPSFALYRDEASAAIASYLERRMGGGR